MKINRFDRSFGQYMDHIPGQGRFYYAIENIQDFFEIPDWIEGHGFYQGDLLIFYDLEKRSVHIPFER